MEILLYVLLAFGGYAIGRIGHVRGGHLKAPHHWIYGFILVFWGIFFHHNPLAPFALSFGAGLFISDLIDFLHLKLLSPDPPGKKNFWGID